MASENDDAALAIAAFRYRLIAEALEVSDAAVAQVLTAIASQTHNDPQGRPFRCTVRTLWRYLHAYRRGGLRALQPAVRRDRGQLRAIAAEVLARAVALRNEVRSRSTETLLDALLREERIKPGEVSRSTLDRHLRRLGCTRRLLREVGQKVFRRIETSAVFELVVCDFHHGPYVRPCAGADLVKRALLCAFIDHYSRFVPESRYYLHEDFAALRFGFRRLLGAYGLPVRLYVDNGASYQATRFHAACDALDIKLVHSKPYRAEGRGVIERFNGTLKDQFEAEVRQRDEPVTLDELNGFWEAWLSERYHRHLHSETGARPLDRFATASTLRQAPEMALVDELLRLRERRTVHRKWSTVEVNATRYLVDPALRGRKVDVLLDPFAPEYVLVVFDGRVIQRAVPQKPGALAPQPESTPPAAGPRTDYLGLLRADFEKRSQAELSALDLRPRQASTELSLADLLSLLARCRAAVLTADERTRVSALWRKLRPLDPAVVSDALKTAERRLGQRLHIDVYLDHLQAHVIRLRAKGGKTP
ncbi:MAG TPA: Mu transposase C-terminal domain-containing protein [Vicinamibacteria bacterium]|nr:Mu transposase C-terminal domain-containing protein [Vicinamibacteria bacterium]